MNIKWFYLDHFEQNIIKKVDGLQIENVDI